MTRIIRVLFVTWVRRGEEVFREKEVNIIRLISHQLVLEMMECKIVRIFSLAKSIKIKIMNKILLMLRNKLIHILNLETIYCRMMDNW
jgi:hypothetical protein